MARSRLSALSTEGLSHLQKGTDAQSCVGTVKVISCLIWYEWQDVSPTCAELNRKSVVEEAVLGWEAKVGSGLGESHTCISISIMLALLKH